MTGPARRSRKVVRPKGDTEILRRARLLSAEVRRERIAARFAEGKKRCPACDQIRSLDEFSPNGTRRGDRLDGWCKACRREDHNARYARRAGRLAALAAPRPPRLPRYLLRCGPECYLSDLSWQGGEDWWKVSHAADCRDRQRGRTPWTGPTMKK